MPDEIDEIDLAVPELKPGDTTTLYQVDDAVSRGFVLREYQATVTPKQYRITRGQGHWRTQLDRIRVDRGYGASMYGYPIAHSPVVAIQLAMITALRRAQQAQDEADREMEKIERIRGLLP